MLIRPTSSQYYHELNDMAYELCEGLDNRSVVANTVASSSSRLYSKFENHLRSLGVDAAFIFDVSASFYWKNNDNDYPCVVDIYSSVLEDDDCLLSFEMPLVAGIDNAKTADLFLFLMEHLFRTKTNNHVDRCMVSIDPASGAATVSCYFNATMH